MTEEEKIDSYKFNINETDDDINQYREVLPVKQYFVGYTVLRKWKQALARIWYLEEIIWKK